MDRQKNKKVKHEFNFSFYMLNEKNIDLERTPGSMVNKKAGPIPMPKAFPTFVLALLYEKRRTIS